MAEIYSQSKTSKMTAFNEIFHCLLNPNQELYFNNKKICNKIILKITKLILDHINQNYHIKLITILWPKSQSYYFHLREIKQLCSLIWAENWNKCKTLIMDILTKPNWKLSSFSQEISNILEKEIKLISCILKNYNSSINENMFIVTSNSVNTCYEKTFRLQKEFDTGITTPSNLSPIYILDKDRDGNFKQYAFGISDIYNTLYDQKDFISNIKTTENFCDDARNSLRKQFELQLKFTRQIYN